MKRTCAKRHLKFTLRLRYYGDYIDDAFKIETILAKNPTRLLIDIVGSGEIPPDSTLLLRSILLRRSAKTHLTTNARSSLQGGGVLVWLLGDTRLIRDDAGLYLRAAGPFVRQSDQPPAWSDRSFFLDEDLEEHDYIRVLHLINEFLPVKEWVDEPIRRPVLKQYALVDTEKLDAFLSKVLQPRSSPENRRLPKSARPFTRRPDAS
jgi:hypothetical protein